MSHITIPEGYQSLLGLYDTQKAIGLIKTIFQEKLCMALHLKRVTAPLFVMQGSGLNDDLNGVERPVSFDVPSLNEQAEVVHSLAKWKRYALYKYGFRPGQGIVTDMNAVRRDEELDNLHSIYVDQWDWERVITADQRTLEFLQETVRDIVDAVCATSDELRWKFPELKNNIHLGREVAFITTQELEDRYPDFTPKQRENAFAKEHGTVCIMQIGGRLKSGQPHDGRAPDYDDWTLNCDILFWHKPLDCALELSSMGIRVDADALRRDIENDLYSQNLLPNLQADILQLIEGLDKINNQFDDVIYKFYIEQPQIPAPFHRKLIELCYQVADCAENMAIASRAFFKDLSTVRDYSHKVYIMEQESDSTYNDLKKAIFASDMELANKLQLDLLITEVADIADIAEDCADELLIFTLKRDI